MQSLLSQITNQKRLTTVRLSDQKQNANIKISHEIMSGFATFNQKTTFNSNSRRPTVDSLNSRKNRHEIHTCAQ